MLINLISLSFLVLVGEITLTPAEMLLQQYTEQRFQQAKGAVKLAIESSFASDRAQCTTIKCMNDLWTREAVILQELKEKDFSACRKYRTFLEIRDCIANSLEAKP